MPRFKDLKQRAFVESKADAGSPRRSDESESAGHIKEVRSENNLILNEDADIVDYFPTPEVTHVDLLKSVVPSSLSQVIVLRDFFTKDEETLMLTRLYSRPWIDIKHRRLQCYGGEPIKDAPRVQLPFFLRRLADHLRDPLGIVKFDINHALVNEYQPGQTIHPHTDGPMYYPHVACLSLGASAKMTFTERLPTSEVGCKEPAELLQLELPPRSLVVFSGDAYANALHGITGVETGVRVAITLRRILV